MQETNRRGFLAAVTAGPALAASGPQRSQKLACSVRAMISFWSAGVRSQK